MPTTAMNTTQAFTTETMPSGAANLRRKEVITMPMYYTINEGAARIAHDANSFSEFQAGRATEEYRYYVDKAAAIAEAKREKFPDESDHIDYLLDRYARELAAWYNEGFRIESMCPSILVSGGGNFPVKKKEKQNARRDSHMRAYENIEKLLNKLQSIGTGGIKSNDARAIEKIEAKLERLQDLQEKMKAVNAYYRKHKTLDGCELLDDDTKQKITAHLNSPSCIWKDAPFAPWSITNNGAEIRRLKKRLENLKAVKDAGTTETEIDEIEGLKVVENTEAMRIQLIFDEKPDENTRSILKGYGFKWSPRFGAWQRMLNDNGKRAAELVIKKIQQG